MNADKAKEWRQRAEEIAHRQVELHGPLQAQPSAEQRALSHEGETLLLLVERRQTELRRLQSVFDRQRGNARTQPSTRERLLRAELATLASTHAYLDGTAHRDHDLRSASPGCRSSPVLSPTE